MKVVAETEASSSTHPPAVPQRFLCPLTLEILRHPVLSRYGHTYERSAILQWLQNNESCPFTRLSLTPRYLISNELLKMEIQKWEASCTTNGGQDDGRKAPPKAPPKEFVSFCNEKRTGEISESGSIYSNFQLSTIANWLLLMQICPLTERIFEHPVVTKDGRRYEHMALMGLVKNGMYSKDPTTGESLPLSSVITDVKLMSRIQTWKELTCYNDTDGDANRCYGWVDRQCQDNNVLVMSVDNLCPDNNQISRARSSALLWRRVSRRAVAA